MILICDDVLIEERFFVEAMAQLNAHNRHDVKVIGKACELQYRCIYDLNHTYATRFAPVDGYTPELKMYHEIKTMVAGKWVNFSPKEKEHADEKLLEGADTCIWLVKYIPPVQAQLIALTKYSKVAHLIRRSSGVPVSVERNGGFQLEQGWYFNPEDLKNNSEKLE